VVTTTADYAGSSRRMNGMVVAWRTS